VARRYAWVGVSWLLAALLYPVIIPAIGLSACVVFLIEMVRTRAMPQKWLWNGALGVASIAIVLLEIGIPDHVGPMVTFEQAQQMAEFGPRGRQTLFGSGWHDGWFLHHRTGIGVPAQIVLAAFAAALTAVALGRGRWIPSAVIVMALTGLALWAVARLTMFALYLPNRHSRWTLAAAAIVVIGVGAVALLAYVRERRAARSPARRSAPRAALLVASLAAPVAVAAALYPSAARRVDLPVDHDLERAYDFLATLPKDTLVAAHPDLANFVPLRSKRAVLASTEASVAFTLGYYAQYVPRIEASLDAAYATDWETLDERLTPFGVDVVLGNAETLADRSYHPPFEARIERLTQGVPIDRFVLHDPPPDRVLFRSGDTVVVEVRKPVAPMPMAINERPQDE
jgi:hypothetical protein